MRTLISFVAVAFAVCCAISPSRVIAQLVLIDFTEGLAPVDQQHSLTSQYEESYGVTFLPSDGNNWTLFGNNLIWPWIDDRGAYVSASSFVLSFSESITSASFDMWLQSNGITGQGGTALITVSSLTAASGGTIIESASYSVSNTSAQVWTGNQYAEPATLFFAPASPFKYISISRPVKAGIDSVAFTPVPEPSTFALLLMTAAGALYLTRKRRPLTMHAPRRLPFEPDEPEWPRASTSAPRISLIRFVALSVPAVALGGGWLWPT